MSSHSNERKIAKIILFLNFLSKRASNMVRENKISYTSIWNANKGSIWKHVDFKLSDVVYNFKYIYIRDLAIGGL